MTTARLVEMSDEDVRAFAANGFTSIGRLISDQAVQQLRVAYDEILDGVVDCGPDDRQLGDVTRQVMGPRSHHEAIRDNEVFERAKEVASQLFGRTAAEFTYDMMIYKPPRHLVETPWHQDFAYFRRPFTPAGATPPNTTVQFWVALDDADETNGCMHFVPGAHNAPLIEHHVHSGDPDFEGRLLAIREPAAHLDLASAVACPLPSGGATAHLDGTPHFTPPNTTTDRGRRAYILNFRSTAVVA